MPSSATPSLDDLRRYAVVRTLFPPTTLGRAIERLGFVQADPIRAPARAQDLVLRHRVTGYRAGDLERRYARLPVEEDFLVNYGFVPRATLALLHPRTARHAWDAATTRRAAEVLEFVRARGHAHPRAVEQRFAHGRTTNWFGGTSNAATQLLDAMHYRGLLRVARRDGGTRVYAPVEHPPVAATKAARTARAVALIERIVGTYAPLPASSLVYLARLLRLGGAPQLDGVMKAALSQVRDRVASVEIDGTTWLWPAGESPRSRRWAARDRALVLAPFDPIVWDRRRFALLWDWTYRFEAYVPAPKRRLGYYAMPLLWRDRAVGWVNASVREGRLHATPSYAVGEPDDAAWPPALARELAHLERFLGLEAGPATEPD